MKKVILLKLPELNVEHSPRFRNYFTYNTDDDNTETNYFFLFIALIKYSLNISKILTVIF